jgi:putative ABC transport system permease protein
MDSLIHDLRHAFRGLRHRPGFALSALLTLALGIGANLAVFTMIDALLLKPLPFGAHSDRVVSLHSTHPTQPEDWEDSRLSFPDLRDVREASRLLQEVAGYTGRGFTLTGHSEAERVLGGSVTPNLFPMIGAQPMLGRPFRDEDAAAPGFEPVVMLSHGLWQRRFGGDPTIVGRQIQINQRGLEVIGVMPEGFRFPERNEMWVAYRDDEAPRERRFVAALGVRRADVTLPQLQHELDGVAATLAARYPAANRGWGLRALPYRDLAFGPTGRVAVFSLMGAVAFVLLIGCANLANLLLARGVSRAREIAVRAAVGASRGRIVRQMLLESLILSTAGALLGAALGRAGLDAMVASWPEELPYWVALDFDYRVAAFLAAAVVATALLCGLVPALRASRPNLIEELKEGARGTGGRGDHAVQGGLIVAQVALCLALLVGANLMIRSFLKLQTDSIGFSEQGLVTLRVALAGDTYDTLPARTAFFRRATERLRALPGVTAVALTSSIPADDGGAPVRVVDERGPRQAGEETGAQMIAIGPSLFDTLGTPLLEGRMFTEAEADQEAPPVAIVSRTLARLFWPDGSPLGRNLGLVGARGTTWLTVVGVAPEVHYEELGEATAQSSLALYVPYGRTGSRFMALLVRGAGPAEGLLQPVRRALFEAEPQVAVHDVHTMQARRALTTWEPRFFGKAMGLFASVALLLSCLGVYGVLTYAVSRRTREIGVRMALGATTTDVLGMVLRQAAMLFALGAGLGLLLALGLTRLLAGILYGVSPTDPLALAGMAALLLVVVLASSLLPARRAARTDPLHALRYD